MIAALLAWLAASTAAPLACGAVTRPGIAERGGDGVWRGRAVDLCRAAAARENGPGAPIAFRSYDTLDALKAAPADRLAFLSAGELAAAPEHALEPGPVVAVERQVLVVPASSRARAPADLAGGMICFIAGTRAEDALDAWAAATRTPVGRIAMQEEVEMRDAYQAGKCAAMALDAQEAKAGDRILAPALAATPILAATPKTAGERWAATIASLVPQGEGGKR